MPEDHAALILDNTQEKVVLLNEDGEFTYANAAAERLLGFNPRDLVGERAFQYIHPADRETVQEAFAETIQNDEYTETTVVYRHQTADGGYVWLESRLSNVTAPELDGYVVSSVDVTKRVEAEAENRSLTERLQEIAATTDEVLWLFSGDWSELLFINDAYEDLYGTSSETLRENPDTFLDQIHPDDRRAVEAAMHRLSDGYPVDVEYRTNPQENYHYWVWVHGDPIVKDGEVVRIVGVTRDITERSRRERQLRVLDNLLRHNLRTGMNIIMGTAELIEDELPDAAGRAEVIRRTGEELLESAEKGRDITQMVTGQPEPKPLDITVILEECLDEIEALHPDGTIRTHVPGDTSVFAIRHVTDALVELLDNAVRYSAHSPPVVEVTVSTSADTVTIEVCSESDPLPPYDVSVLEGDHEMSELYHSSGLGLWLVYWVADLSNGTTAVTKNTADTVCIELTLPAAQTSVH